MLTYLLSDITELHKPREKICPDGKIEEIKVLRKWPFFPQRIEMFYLIPKKMFMCFIFLARKSEPKLYLEDRVNEQE